MRCVIAIAVLLLHALARGQVAAPAPATYERFPQQPYCGVYCLYAVALGLGVEPQFNQLLQRKYIGCPLGSSVAELKQAAVDLGLNASAFSNLSVSALEQLSCPAILHVRSEAASRDYDHYIAVLSVNDGEAVVLDPGRPTTTVKLSRLRPIWSGTALLVSNRPMSRLQVALATWATFGGYVVAACCGLVVLARAHRLARLGPHRPLRAFCQASLIVTLVALGALAYHRIAPNGLFGSAALASSVDAAFAPVAFPHVRLSEVEDAVESQSAALIDARSNLDYAAGHIPGSLNLQPDADEYSRRRAMSEVSINFPLIVYCQSSRCRYSELVARKLKSDGFHDVRLYGGGWEEWSTTRRATEVGRNAR